MKVDRTAYAITRPPAARYTDVSFAMIEEGQHDSIDKTDQVCPEEIGRSVGEIYCIVHTIVLYSIIST